MPNLAKKAQLVVQRHQVAIKKGLQEPGSVQEFLRINNQVDQEIRAQNQKYKKVNLVFLLFDCLISLAILCTSVWLTYEIIYLDKAYVYAF